jgi:hypothetical protein
MVTSGVRTDVLNDLIDRLGRVLGIDSLYKYLIVISRCCQSCMSPGVFLFDGKLIV